MTIQELETLINEWRSGGADDYTPVLLATQPEYPLVHELRSEVAVVYEGDPDGGDGVAWHTGSVAHVLLCEGSQRYDMPYTTDAEAEVLQEAGWGR